jgi:colanic acid biosynthesis glycosyl transferase WcaI
VPFHCARRPLKGDFEPVSSHTLGMRILIFTQHFPPETVATGRRAFDLAESMAKRGHQVAVITGVPNHPSSLGRPFCQSASRREISPSGYRIVRVPVFRSQDARALRRLLTYGTFALSAARAGFRQERPDAILAVSPLPTGLAAMLVHWGRRAPLVFDLQDIWPDSAVAVGVMQSSPSLRLLRRLERFFYRRCALIVGITEGFRQYLLSLGVSPERLAVIHNGVDWQMFGAAEAAHASGNSHQPDSKFVVGYVGNLGLAQGLETLLDAADALREGPVRFLLAGEGTDKPRLRKLARIRGLENVEFMDGVPRDHVAPILAACDSFLLVLRKHPLFEITIPSKVYEYMAAGKPILCSVGGEASTLVSSSRCGLVVKPSDGEALAAAIETLRDNPALCRKMGESGKRCARERFSMDSLMAGYAELVEGLAPAGRKPAIGTVRPASISLSFKKPWRFISGHLLRMFFLIF